jgi:hypothetical protein
MAHIQGLRICLSNLFAITGHHYANIYFIRVKNRFLLFPTTSELVLYNSFATGIDTPIWLARPFVTVSQV